MIAYPFPPAAHAGVFRTVRFVRYLGDFGWMPLVVAPAASAFRSGLLDESLGAAIPLGTVIHRTAVLRPIFTLENRVARMREWFHRAPTSVEGHGGETISHAIKSADATTPSSLRRGLRTAVELIFATPDAHVGWMLPALKAALTLVRRHRPRAIYCTSPPHSANLVAVVLKAITGLPLVTDFRDPWARSEWSRREQQSLRDRVQVRLERLCVERSDRVILNTPRLRDEFRAAYPGKTADTLLTISNGYEPEMLSRIQGMIAVDGRATANGSIRVCHAGSVYGERDLRPLVAAVRGLLQSGHKVNLEQIGPTDREAEIGRYLCENHLDDHIKLRGWLPHEQTLERLAASDVLAVIQPGTTLQVPAKLFELLLFRKPILALTGQGATADIINGFGLGTVADPGDSQAIVEAILRVANKQSVCNDTGWDRALSAFDGRRLTGELAQVLDSLI